MTLPFKIDIENLPVIPFRHKGREGIINSFPIICGIYKITSPNGAIYIGLSNDIYHRIHKCYRSLNCKNQKRIYNSLNKYGVNLHLFEIIHVLNSENLSKYEIISELNKLERHYISLFKSYSDDNELGLNLTRGGDLMELTKETWDKINESKKGRKQSKETISKRVDKIKGIKPKPQTIEAAIKANTGIVRSPETRQKLRDANLGKKQSQETIEKKRQTKKANGKKITEEQRLKMSESKKGNKNPNFGKPAHNRGKKGQKSWNKGIPMTEESKRKISESCKGKIPWNKGLKMNPISVEKTAAKNRGRKQTEEHKARTAETKRIKREERLKLKNKNNDR